MTDTSGKKRSLTHVGGEIETQGDHGDAESLARALEVQPSTDDENDPSRLHIHGFHTYPARMHPISASRLIEGFSPRGGNILDPFCGSGTVLIESLIAGRNAMGVDLNPLAVLLTKCKTRIRTKIDSDHLLLSAREIVAKSEERRLAKTKPLKRYTKADLVLFEPHILMELDSIRGGIESKKNHPVAIDLWMVLSSMLVKFSRQEGDTSTKVVRRGLAPGFPGRHFLRKTEELIRKSGEFQKRIGDSCPFTARAWQGNAQLLKGLEIKNIDAVITSPPYAATYDYNQHHALRLRWLGLKSKEFEKGEMGGRAAYRFLDPGQALSHWRDELTRFLTAASVHLKPGSPLVLVIADSSVGHTALRAEILISQIARDCGFFAAARASQARPHFHGPGLAAFRQRPRMEHAIALRRI